MNRKEIITVVSFALVVAFCSYLLSGVIFKSSSKKESVVAVQAINPTLPDINTDPIYKAFLNTNALNPTQLIKIGNGNKNTVPFR